MASSSLPVARKRDLINFKKGIRIKTQKEPKALLLRVGADTTDRAGGYLGSIAKDGEFIWTPMPHHSDPNWKELSYGDQWDKKKGIATKIFQLKDLIPKDLLVFYAGLKCIGVEGAYIIGYFFIKKKYDFIKHDLSNAEYKKIVEDLNRNYTNPHIKRLKHPGTEEIIIIGEAGGLLTKAIKIGSLIPKVGPSGKVQTARLEMDPEYFYLGYQGDLTQSGAGHWINYEKIWKLLKDKELQSM